MQEGKTNGLVHERFPYLSHMPVINAHGEVSTRASALIFVARKLVFGVSDNVRFKPACSAIETAKKNEKKSISNAY